MNSRSVRGVAPAFLLLAFLVGARNLQAARITVGSATANPGGTVQIPLVYSGEGQQLISLGLALRFPETVSFVTAELGPIVSSPDVAAGISGSTGIASLSVYPATQAGFDRALPDGLLATLTLSVSPNASGTLVIFADPQAHLGNLKNTGEIVMITVPDAAITVACTTPGAPTITSAAAALTAGQNYAARWSAASGLSDTGVYVVETSTSDAFTSIVSSQTTPRTDAIVPTVVSAQDSTLYVRVRAVQTACTKNGPASAPVALTVRGLPETFTATSSNLSLTGTVGGSSTTGTATFRNVGARNGSLSLGVTGSGFDVTPSVLTLAPGQEGSVSITARASALSAPAIVQATLVGTSANRSVRLPVTLSVAPAATSSRAGTRLQATPLTVAFSAPAGQNPSPQTVRVTVQPVGSGPLYLSASVGPGGSWLVPPPELSSPVPASNELTLTLAVNRSQRSADDGVAPYSTLLTLTPVGGSAADAVVVQVRDVETSAVGAGAGRAPLTAPPGGTSFIVPSSVRASGVGGAVFTSDGWLKNESSAPVSTDFFFTPDGADGLAGAGVKKATQTIPAGATLRLADLVSSLFQADGVSGQVEARAATPGSLSLRTSVEAVTGGDAASRYGTEIPVVAYGSGIGANEGALALPGIDDDADRRANVILTETAGAPAKVNITVYGAAGETIGATTRDVPAFGKVQINRLVQAVSPGASLTGGWAAVSVTSGSGRVVPVATVIDNRSNSFSAVRGQGAPATASVPSAGRRSLARPRPLAGAPRTLVLPSAARLTGAANTRFTTRVAMVNATAQPATLTMTYNYVDVADGSKQKSVSVPLVLAPRAALPRAMGEDVIATLFGLTGPTFGWMAVQGDVQRVVATTAVSAQVDPNDPSKGVKTAQVGGLYSDADAVMVPTASERRFAGAEKSIQKRTNLALVETSGQPAKVTVRAYSTGGLKLAEKTYDLAANQYVQITDVFGGAGVNLGDGPFQNVEITAQVTDGTGHVVGVASVNDNLSRNPQLFVLEAPGPETEGTIGF